MSGTTHRPSIEPDEIRRALDVLFEPNQVIEVRAFNGKNPDIGFYDDHEVLLRDLVKRAGRYSGTYVTLQRINPALLARRFNRMEAGGLGTSDGDIQSYRWIPLDFDPVRPADISSSDVEHELAIERARAARDWLVSEGFDRYVLADSGNGAHLLLPVDYGVARKEEIRSFLAGVGQRMGDERVKVDQTVFNPARIWKLYGTVTRKGDDFNGGRNNPARPHRVARLLEVRL